MRLDRLAGSRASSSISSSSTWSRPAVSTIRTSRPCARACSSAFAATATGSRSSRRGRPEPGSARPSCSSWSIAAGRWRSQAASAGRLPLLLAQAERELRRRRRLARALEAGEQDDGRRTAGERELRAPLAHERGQLLVHDLHDLLAGRQALHHLGAERALLDPREELLDDLEVDVRLEQREADLAQSLLEVLLGEHAAPAEAAEDPLELVGERVEHEPRIVGAATRPPSGGTCPGATFRRDRRARRAHGDDPCPTEGSRIREDAADVLLDGTLADDERVRDRSVGPSFGHECQNLALAPRQVVQAFPDKGWETTSGSITAPRAATRSTASANSCTSAMRSFSR